MEPSTTEPTPLDISFGSDNHAPVHPEVLEGLRAVNDHFAHGYGDDPWTKRANDLLTTAFGGSHAFLVPTGTMANALALAAMAPLRGQAVLCADSAHANIHEAGAVEALGIKLLPMPSTNGLVDLDELGRRLLAPQDVHEAQIVGASLSLPTEFGTLYDDAQIKAIMALAHPDKTRPLLHLDGARLFTAITDALADANCLEGIRKCVDCYAPDIISVGFTKIGGMDMDAIVCRDQALAGNLARLVKRQGGLLSKHRYAAAQVIAMLHPDEKNNGRPLALLLAKHACDMAGQLRNKLRHVPGVTLCAREVGANMVFAKVPGDWLAPLRDRFGIYPMGERNEIRMVCSWATTPSHIGKLVSFMQRGCKDA